MLGHAALPISLLLIGLLGVWLGIFGPLPVGVSSWLHHWRSLIAATIASTIASIAAYVAFQNTSRSLHHAEGMEKNRRERKHAAVRAVLPLALSQVNSYAAKTAQLLNEVVGKCDNETLPHGTATDSLIQVLAPEALETLTDFIEFTDGESLEVLEATVAWIQIHESRMRRLVQDNNDPSTSLLVLRNELEERINALAAIPTAPWTSRRCDDRGRPLSGSLSNACGAGRAQRCGAMPTSEDTLADSGARTYPISAKYVLWFLDNCLKTTRTLIPRNVYGPCENFKNRGFGGKKPTFEC